MGHKNEILNLTQITEDIGIIIGNFDGFHLGHRTLLKHFIQECFDRKIKPVAVTFSPHPHLYFHQNETDFLLSDYQDKINFLTNAGVSLVNTIQFSKDLQEMKADDFLLSHIFSCQTLKYIHLGHDFRLGHGKVDAKKILVKLADGYRVEIGYESAFKLDEKILSSSKIRELVKSDITLANKYLDRNYSLKGHVVKGKGIGARELLPTANLSYDPQLRIPACGVYISETLMDGEFYESVTNIGINPTVSDENREKNTIGIETYLLHFNGDIYNKNIEVFFIEKIRDEKKFDSFLDLKDQIFCDVENAKNYYRNKSPYKLALIGKNIAHSKSQIIYERIFKKSVNYTLLDYQKESDIAEASTLLNTYQGVSITAPYKEHFSKLRKKEITTKPIVNTLFQENGQVFAANTDALAILEILEKYKSHGIEKVFLLGDGCMSKITEEFLNNQNIAYEIFSRKNGKLSTIASVLNKIEQKNQLKKLLIINTCSRVYCFDGPKNKNYHFWDMNYTLDHHIEYFKNSEVLYQDGIELLELQAKYAVKLWNLI